MNWLRALILLVPLVPVALGWLAFRKVRTAVVQTEGPSEDTLTVGYWGETVELDLLDGRDRISRGVASIVLDPLLRINEAGEMTPALATSWSEAQRTSFFFLTENDASAAAEALLAVQNTKWAEWDLLDAQLEGTTLELALQSPWPGAEVEVSKLFDPTGLARVSQIRIELNEPVARQYHRLYLESALESAQIRRVWFDGESSYELTISGDPAPFMEELGIYYRQAANNSLLRLELIGEAPGISEPTLTFDLTRNRQWHDGESFDAEDLLFTLAHLQSLPDSNPLSPIFRPVIDVEAHSLHELTLSYRAPLASALVAWADVRILPSHYLESPERDLWPEDAPLRLPGTGPYRVLGRGEEGGLILGAAGGERPFARIHLTPYEDLLGLRAALHLKKFDLYLPELNEVPSLESKDGVTITYARTGIWTVGEWNTIGGPCADPATRAALALAIDPRALIDNQLRGTGSIITSLFPVSLRERPTLPLPVSSPRDAASALDVAGWKMLGSVRKKSGTELSLRLVTNADDPVRLDVARAIAETWRALGARVELIPRSQSEIVSQILPDKEFEFLLHGIKPGESWDISRLWPSRRDPDTDRLLKTIARSYNQTVRAKLAAEFQNHLVSSGERLLLFERSLPTANLQDETAFNPQPGASLWKTLREEKTP